MIKQIKNMHETGQWPKDFTELAMIALKKKPKATKCSDNTFSVIVHIAHTVMMIFRRRIERSIEGTWRSVWI
jgi:hypothetical protein